MSRSKHKKTICEQVEECGLKLLDMSQNKSGHLRLHIKNKYGKTKLYFTALSPSDWRGAVKRRSDFRRFSRERN